jgi:small-conductance mechanosensitive channel
LLAVTVFTFAAASSHAGEHVPHDLQADQVESFVAPLSDAEARKLLIENLKHDAASPETPDATALADGSFIEEQPSMFAAGLDNMTRWLPELPGSLAQVMGSAPVQSMWAQVGPSLAITLTALLCAAIIEWLVRRSFSHLKDHMHSVSQPRPHTRFGLASLRLLLDGLSLGLFAGVAFLLGYWLTAESVYARMLVEQALTAIILVRGLSALARFMFSPRAQGLRLFEMSNEVALTVYRFVLALGGFGTIAGLAGNLLHQLGLPESHYTMLFMVIGSLVFIGMITLTWYVRAPIALAIAGGPPLPLDDSQDGRNLLAHVWHFLASAFLILTGALWSANTAIGKSFEATAAISSLAIVILIPVIDGAAHAFLAWIISRHVPLHESLPPSRQGHLTLALRKGLRIALLVGALVLLVEASGFGVSSLLETEVGRGVFGGLLDIGIIFVLGYLAWDLFKHFIGRWVPEEDEGPTLPSDGEGGGAGASRAQTLIPLLRTFVLLVLIVMVTMLVLDQLGVNIGPLIAGAGVVGLAIGFGAQKLVQDVISGVFFLIDDAFRKGEYLEINDLRGSVEKISIRSMQLRHHRGPLQTVPFSEIPFIKNYSRDWIIMKLEFRVPYDTDVERLRKLIKKLGLELLKDEELGPSFIEPLKSQGVNRMEHTAMVIRMKFTAVPGEQWVLRREVYRYVQELLQREGITFAKPVVSVQIDDEGSGQKKLTSAAAGAAAMPTGEEGASTEDDVAEAR